MRTQISRLRQKLDSYFESDGSWESMRIVIPRGGYVPFFVPHEPIRTLEVPATNELGNRSVLDPQPVPIATPRAVTLAPFRRSNSHEIAWVLAALFALALVAVLVRDTRRRVVPIPSHPLWSQIFRPGEPALIVPADSTLVFWQSLTKHNIDLAEYLKGSFREDAVSAGGGTEKTGKQFGQGRYTSIVDLEASSRLSQLAIEQKSSASIRYARDVRPNDLKEDNVVLIGTTEANPWVSLFEKDMNFVFHMDRERKVFSVWNKISPGRRTCGVGFLLRQR